MPSGRLAAAIDNGLPYTGNGGTGVPTPMAVPWSRFVTPRRVLFGLTAGFALVLVLLGMACLIAVRGTQAIQRDAEHIIREELTIARLLNEVQAEENAEGLRAQRRPRSRHASQRTAQHPHRPPQDQRQ